VEVRNTPSGTFGFVVAALQLSPELCKVHKFGSLVLNEDPSPIAFQTFVIRTKSQRVFRRNGGTVRVGDIAGRQRPAWCCRPRCTVSGTRIAQNPYAYKTAFALQQVFLWRGNFLGGGRPPSTRCLGQMAPASRCSPLHSTASDLYCVVQPTVESPLDADTQSPGLRYPTRRA
jgi:hypothetical protein